MLGPTGAERRVAVKRSGSGFVVDVDSVRYEVDYAVGGPLLRSLICQLDEIILFDSQIS